MITKALFVLFMLVSFIHTGVQAPYSVTGVIRDNETGTPVQYVHVFTVKGEEEAITNSKGEFQFQTWLRSAELTTEKEGYQRKTVSLSFPSPRQTILLQRE